MKPVGTVNAAAETIGQLQGSFLIEMGRQQPIGCIGPMAT